MNQITRRDFAKAAATSVGALLVSPLATLEAFPANDQNDVPLKVLYYVYARNGYIQYDPIDFDAQHVGDLIYDAEYDRFYRVEEPIKHCEPTYNDYVLIHYIPTGDVALYV